MPPIVFPNPDELGRALAEAIAEEIEDAAVRGRRYLLGCPGGRSVASTYRALADEVAARVLDLRHVVIVMMDEYVEPDGVGGYQAIDSGLGHSCRRFGQIEIVDRLNRAADPSQGISADRLWVPDPANPADYDRRIADFGGIDLFLLASGAGDGHIAFNPPGSDRDSTTRVVALPEQTRIDNLATFPSYGCLEDVPRHGVTVGLGTIRHHSRRVVMVVHGSDKQTAASRLISAQGYESDWPATVFVDCAEPQLYLDAAANTLAVGAVS